MLYDLIILGAGAAGMTASIYASRYKINHLLFGDKVGGQFVDAHLIENYPGFTSIDGFGLMSKFRQHVESYGVKVREERIGEIKRVDGSDSVSLAQGVPPPDSVGTVPPQRSLKHLSSPAGASPTNDAPPLASESFFEVKTESGEMIQARTLILAMGARHRALNVPGEENFLGKGVSYCSTCDAPLFKGKTVAVVGGGNSAVTAAIHASEFATKVYIVHRGAKLEKAEPIWLEALEKKSNVEKIFNSQVKELLGDKLLTGLKLFKSGEAGEEVLEVQGVFIEIGLVPAVSLANQIGVEADALGYLKTKGDMATNVGGIFAAGDLAKQSDVPQLRQIITSAGQGALAAAAVYAFINQKMPGPSWG